MEIFRIVLLGDVRTAWKRFESLNERASESSNRAEVLRVSLPLATAVWLQPLLFVLFVVVLVEGVLFHSRDDRSTVIESKDPCENAFGTRERSSLGALSVRESFRYERVLRQGPLGQLPCDNSSTSTD